LQITLAEPGAVTHALNESEPMFSPDALKLSAPDKLLNDVTVIGRVEPREYVKDYFLGDGFSLGFNLSYSPFTRRASTILEEEFRGNAFDATRWTKADPASALSVSGGKLNLAGGTGADGGTTLAFTELLELGGALTIQHGELQLTAASNGVIGGLYASNITQARIRSTTAAATHFVSRMKRQPRWRWSRKRETCVKFSTQSRPRRRTSPTCRMPRSPA
jgi:hypothetical protein